MRLPCPYCGERDLAEFVCRGAALQPRPDPEAQDAEAQFYDWLYLRDNLPGELDEHWYHASGCRNWLVIRRDTRDHGVLASRVAGEAGP